MEIKYMSKTKTPCPEIIVIAGSNGSGNMGVKNLKIKAL